VGTIYLSTGRVARLFLVTLGSTPFVIAAFVIGLRWGIEGVAFAYAGVSIAVAYASLFFAFRLISLKFSDFHRVVLPPLIVSIAMAVTVMAFNHAANMFLPVTTRLIVSVLLGMGLYVLLSLLANKAQITQLLEAVRANLMR
jgi:PST family polysaccharide transporter